MQYDSLHAHKYNLLSWSKRFQRISLWLTPNPTPFLILSHFSRLPNPISTFLLIPNESQILFCSLFTTRNQVIRDKLQMSLFSHNNSFTIMSQTFQFLWMILKMSFQFLTC